MEKQKQIYVKWLNDYGGSDGEQWEWIPTELLAIGPPHNCLARKTQYTPKISGGAKKEFALGHIIEEKQFGIWSIISL